MDFQRGHDVPMPPPRATGTTAKLRMLKPGESDLFPSITAVAIAFRLFGKGNYRSHKERDGIRIWRCK